MTHSQTHPIRRTIALAAVAALACLGLGTSSAGAAYDHSVVDKEFTIPGCVDIISLAVDETREYIYASCEGAGYPQGRYIARVDYEGNPVGFTSTASHVQNNEITESKSNPSGSLGEPRIAVDNSGANNGYIFAVTGSGTAGGSEFIDVYAPSGDYVQSIAPSRIFAPTKVDIDVDENGFIYPSEGGFAAFNPVIAKINPNFQEVERLYTLLPGYGVAIDSTGAAWELISEPSRIVKFEEDQFSPDLTPGYGTAANDWEKRRATPSPYAANPLTEGSLAAIDVNHPRNDLYVNRGNVIEVYSQGTAAEPSYKNAPSFGAGKISGARSMVVLDDHRVFSSSSGAKVVRFGAGKILPDVLTNAAALDDIKQKSAKVTGVLKTAGGGPITGCTLEYGTTQSYGKTASCTPDPSVVNFNDDTAVSAELTELNTGSLYHYRFKATNANGSNFGVNRTVRPSFVLKVQTLPATNITDDGATLRGSFNPDGKATTFKFQYGVDTNYGLETPEQSGGSGTSDFEATAPISGLKSGRVWHYRIVATNADGTTVGADRTFRTASAPEIGGVRATDVTENSATIRATVDPVGYAATYWFEYGTTAEYGQRIPLEDGNIPAGDVPVEVEHQIGNLQPGVTYHFRIVAENVWGESVSADTTFDFSPPSCPNAHVRQQTQSSYLPDCRAYELVSPSSAGAILLQPGAQIWEQFAGQGPDGFRLDWSLNKGLATSPSRFHWYGGLGAVAGLNGKVPDSIEPYLSTRTPEGWKTTYPAYKDFEIVEGGRHDCSETLSHCLEHDEGNYGQRPPEMSAGVFTADGKLIDEWPTNVSNVPNGKYFVGAMRTSGDFGHFVFSSSNVVFAPGGLTGGLGSAYDNDTKARTIEVISLMPNGDPIMQDGPDSQYQRIEFPGISSDGSHILMQTPSSEGKHHLYMRFGGNTYDVARGAGVTFLGMTRDGSKVNFLASQALLPEDTDTSDDIYQWSEDDTLTVVSQGNGQGDGDGCTSNFSSKCSVEPVDTEFDLAFNLTNLPGIDDRIADNSGDVYFYSPELLDPDAEGIEGQKNLYAFHNGAPQLVSTLDLGTEITRINIAPDGGHAGLVTSSQMTSFETAGRQMMYAYDATTGTVFCSSCNPTGALPQFDVEAAMNGQFMSDDGRTFFATKEALVARDTNGTVIDIYEYVAGRPQLITPGVGARDFTGGSKAVNLFLQGVNTGLEAVSGDGQDVYFSTYDTLVEADQNGEFVKFYDARTNGGFPEIPDLGPCAAADECHGTDSTPPVSPVVATENNLGKAGNLPVEKKATKRKCKKGKVKRKGKCVKKRSGKKGNGRNG